MGATCSCWLGSGHRCHQHMAMVAVGAQGGDSAGIQQVVRTRSEHMLAGTQSVCSRRTGCIQQALGVYSAGSRGALQQ
jgi:hypothetical protein